MPSRVKKVRAAPRVARVAPDVAVGRAPGGATTQNAGPGQSAQPGVAHASRRSLKNWRVRSRLLLLIIIPTLTAVVLGGSRIVTSVQNAVGYQRVETLANLSYYITNTAAKIEDERDQTIWYIGLGPQGRAGNPHVAGSDSQNNLQLVTQLQGLTKPWTASLERQIANIGDSYPSQIQTDAHNISQLITKFLPDLRQAAAGVTPAGKIVKTKLPALVVMQQYTNIISQLLAIDDDIALNSGDQQLATDVRALGLVSRIAEETSEQRALLDYAYQQGFFGPGIKAALSQAISEENSSVSQFDVAATPQQVTLFKTKVEGGLEDFASSYEDQAISSGIPLILSPNTPGQVNGAFSSGTIQDQRKVEQSLVNSAIKRASALRTQAIVTASAIGAAVLIVLLLALLLTTIVGRSMVRPLRRLRSGALEVAGVRLPETVRRMSDTDGAGISLDVEPIDVDSADEIGEVARAFDQVHREALRLAANEAALRGNVNAMFVNLSRRSQSLVERQIRLIDDLEQGEQDADRLSSLFQMDHLATRMRRNSENLLVLAGHDASRRWNQPVALVDVLRAAVSEIEQYERVSLNVQPGIAVRGHAVNDVVHLLAELAENATSFSSAETPVIVAGHLLSSGGVLLDITDQGVGMGAEEMAHANWRLDNPPVVDVAVSRRMGLFVVARLAARHGIRVRLRPATAGGLTALVWLPDEVISHETDAGAPGMRRFDPINTGGSLQGPAVAALPAGPNGMPSGNEAEINAARTPKFAPLPVDAGGAGPMGPRRVPGAGPHPGSAGWGSPSTTSPLPAITEADVPASAESAEQFADADFESAGLDASDLMGQPVSQNLQSLAGQNSPSGVVVPPAEHVATENRLPIFEAVESDWFRRGRTGMAGWAAAPQESVDMPTVSWSSPSDRGWEAAAALASPSTGGTTDAGLPRRVPQANLVPGAANSEQAAPAPARSAAATRERFASFQRGIREGRAAASSEDGFASEDDGSL